jgi:hypothetical protein
MVRGCRRLWCSPANRNEYIKLKLPGAWEPPDSARALQTSEAKETHYGFLDGNQVKEEKNGGYSMQAGFFKYARGQCRKKWWISTLME